MAAGQADFDAGDFADEAVADDLGGFAERRLRALPGTGLPDALVLLDGFDDGLLLGNGAGERLLAVDVLLVLAASVATSACQLSGTASMTASMSLRAIISR